ncbi:MAG: SRPBCC family protein [Pseudomonadota bacterium]
MATIYAKADVSLPNDTDVVVKRSFRAPRELVWRAHTEPSLVQRWMLGPPGWSMPVCEMDLREGGTYRWRWRSDESGKEFGFFGEFTNVEAPAALAFSEFYDPGDVGGDMGNGADVSYDFVAHDGVTTMNTRMRFKSKAERDAAVSTGMTDGMEMGYQRLDKIAAEQC